MHGKTVGCRSSQNKLIRFPILNSRAFTLAEVLITLGIIGVVAAITIKTLGDYTNGLELKSALQKDVSVLSQAVERMAQDNGGNLQGVFILNDLTNNVNAFKNYLSYIKICTNNYGKKGCWPDDGNWYAYDGSPVALTSNLNFYTSNGGIVLKDGSLLLISSAGSSTCATGAWAAYENSGTSSWKSGDPLDCEVVWVDVNGFKGPNRVGRDIFALSIRSPGIVYPGVYREKTIGLGCAGEVLQGKTCP